MMFRRYLPLALAVLASLVSCTRDHLYYSATNCATVRVDVDWTKTGLKPNGVSIFAYNSDGSLYRRFDPTANTTCAYVQLPSGKYDLVVMNDSPEEFATTMEFKGLDNFNTFRACGLQSRNVASIVSPDTLAITTIRGVEITPDMIDYFHDKPSSFIDEQTQSELKAEPHLATSLVTIKAHVKGLHYAKGTTISYLRGVSAGYYLGQDRTLEEQSSHSFILNNRTFDPGSTSDGTISASFSSFGKVDLADARYYLDINFVLIDGTSYPLTYDVTDLITVDVELSLQLKLSLTLEIELPEAIGDSGEGSFTTEVNEWLDVTQDVEL